MPSFLDRPGHAQPAAGAELLRERGVVADDPRVLEELALCRGLQRDLGRFLLKRAQLVGKGEVHRRATLGPMVIRPIEPDEYARLGVLTLRAYTTLDGHVASPTTKRSWPTYGHGPKRRRPPFSSQSTTTASFSAA